MHIRAELARAHREAAGPTAGDHALIERHGGLWAGGGREAGAAGVNWLTMSSSAPASVGLTFILPLASSNTRRPQMRSTMRSASASVSDTCTPSRTRKPLPMRAVSCPPIVTDASFTRVMTALMLCPPVWVSLRFWRARPAAPPCLRWPSQCRTRRCARCG